MKPRVAITIGDPNGIGAEVVLKSLPFIRRYVTPVLVGPEVGWSAWARRLKLPDPAAATRAGRQAIDIIDPAPRAKVRIRPGILDRDAGEIAGAALQTAVRLAEGGTVDAVVTAPVSKRALHLAGLQAPGQTEILRELTGAPEVAMMLVHKSFRVGLVTIHEPLACVSALITRRALVQKIGVLAAALRIDWGIRRPRIAVLGLNPHAGENGDLGHEEENVITPALAWLRRHGVGARGPYPADSFFARRREREFDIVVAMYHDQGLIPLKAAARGAGVNVTAGLPIVRTSPDHGTAFDIAGRGCADPASMIEAVRLAARLWENRVRFNGGRR
jgi:4-phospho-D-threonate 3-dehydrogenase / 4-phospho-D-erythronate 3-dehydrogenase